MSQKKIAYERIRENKLVQYGTDYKDWMWILIKQYKDRTHFIFELLQNAEDAKASEVKLLLYKDRLVIEHNGIEFSESDIVSITNVAKSTKNNENSGSIGKFGIGFKSVYVYTKTPRIYSGEYSFEIKDFIMPFSIPSKSLKKGLTRIEIPFDSDEVEPLKAFNEIRNALYQHISATSILFLNNIEHLEIVVENNPDKVIISKEDRERSDGNGYVLDVNVMYSRGKKSEENDYLVFTDCEENPVKIAFMRKGKELVPIRNSRVFTFFPTDVESHQAFYIHAPFETTPARDNIVNDSEYNQELINNICDGIHMAFCWMRDYGYLSIAGLNATYPIYKYQEDSLFYGIYETAVNIIKSGEPMIPTNKPGEFKGIKETLHPDNMTMVEIFSDEDIQRLFGNRKIYWMAKEITKGEFQQLRNFLKENFELKIYTWKDVVEKINASFLKTKERSWYENLFAAIRSFAVSGKERSGSHDIDVSGIPFVRLASGENICPFVNGKPVAYLNNPDVCQNKIEAFFLKSEIIRRFYEINLQVPEFNIERIVIDNILPKYRDKAQIEVSATDLKENIQDLKSIKTAMMISPTVGELVKESYVVTDGNQWFRPIDVHIPSGFESNIHEYRLVRDVLELDYISIGYESDPMLDERFFISIGCSAGLRKTELDKTKYLNLVAKYIGRTERDEIKNKLLSKSYFHGIKWGTMFEGFPEAFDDVDFKKSKELARFFNKNSVYFQISGEVAAANDRNFTGANVDTMKIYSGIGILLTFVPWIFTKDGVKSSVRDIHRRDIDPTYEKEARRLMDMLPFLEEDQAIETILSKIEDPNQRAMVHELLTNGESLQKFTRAWQDIIIGDLIDREKKKTPQELLEKLSARRGRGRASDSDDNPDSIKNLERRKKKLEKEFEESMDNRITVRSTTLKYTYHDQISPEEKQFLQVQYNGHCQICNTTILKWKNQEHLFQAINVMRTSDLAKEYKGSLDTGWNSLCLCPNCAAKYQHGVKDMSDFYEQVKNKQVEEHSYDYISIRIGLQDREEFIKYTPKHFLALKTALEVYSKK